MPAELSSTGTASTAAEPPYAHDQRWLLVQRVLASPGFQRAAQLRRILEYITRAALLNPGTVLREYEIACEVLGRRANFDPTNDNIVRSQMSQLRRRLDAYFTEEAPGEPLRITIPKGAYLPQFHSAPPVSPVQLAPAAATVPTAGPAGPLNLPGTSGPASSARWSVPSWAGIAALAASLLICAVAGVWLYREQHGSVAAPNPPAENALVEFLRHKGTEVTVVVPDLSLMLLQTVLNTNLSTQDYNSNSGVLAAKTNEQADPDLRNLLTAIRERRLTTVNEALAAADVKETLLRHGVTATVRFARDMHTRDFGEGNLILIGSRRSNPWTQLFDRQTNFRYSEAPVPFNYLFKNITPAPGEPSTYVPFEKREGKLSSYADVVLTSNLTHSGYVLLIDGSDYAANDAAARYLMHGRLRDDFSALLRRDDLTYFEVLLGGAHANNDSEEVFEPVALRSLPPVQ